MRRRDKIFQYFLYVLGAFVISMCAVSVFKSAISADIAVTDEQTTEVETIEQTSELEVIETETHISISEYLHQEAERQNELLLAQREEFLNSLEETTTEEETVPVWEPYAFLALSSDVQYGIKNACDEYQVAYDLIIAICIQESSLNPNCVGDNGKAFGLGQIREEYWTDTALSLGLYDWKTDAVQNATMVCYLMSRQLNQYHHTMEEALNIYRHGVMDDITEPDGMTYVEHIMSSMHWLEDNK